MDPVLEQLHLEQQKRVSDAPSRREWVTESLAALLLVAVCGVLWVTHGSPAVPDPLLVLSIALLYGLALQVMFEVGVAFTTPIQLLFIPLWFAVDPALLPLVVAGGTLLGYALATAREPAPRRWSRVLIAVPDAWYAVGPAVVLTATGASDPDPSAWPIYLAALTAQLVIDVVACQLRAWGTSGVRPGVAEWRMLTWVAGVDAALAPIGLVVALGMVAEPATLLAILPLVGLLAQFAKERDDRIGNALELSRAYRGTAQLMGDVLEADDAYTGGEHTQGVVELSLAVGRELGLDASAMRTLEFGALLHDIGKLRVPNEIINKPGKLNAAEWAIIREHPGYGQEMLDRVGGALSDAGAVVRAHHERWDGAGYPDGLARDDIPVEARVITVCDSFSAMTTNRSYRAGMTRMQAAEELDRCSGSQFDPAVVAALHAVLERLPDLQSARAPLTARETVAQQLQLPRSA